MAQDLEKSELGRTLVEEHEGLKYISGRKALMALLAAAAETNKRLEAVGA